MDYAPRARGARAYTELVMEVIDRESKRRLGRGLEALLGREEGGFEPGSFEAAELIQVAVDQVDPNPFQPRRQFDPAEIASLADSLRQHGMLQPILVRAVGLRYQLIAGERRLRASIEAQLHEIPARVLDLDDQRVFELAMVENLQREDLNAIDKAGAFRDYLSRYGGTQEELAGRLGIDRSTVSNLIRLLELPERDPRRGPLQPDQPGARPRPARPGGFRDPARSLADASSPNTSPSARPRPSSARACPPRAVPGSARTRHTARMPGLPISSIFEQALHRQLGTTVAVRARTPGTRADRHRLPFPRGVRPPDPLLRRSRSESRGDLRDPAAPRSSDGRVREPPSCLAITSRRLEREPLPRLPAESVSRRSDLRHSGLPVTLCFPFLRPRRILRRIPIPGSPGGDGPRRCDPTRAYLADFPKCLRHSGPDPARASASRLLTGTLPEMEPNRSTPGPPRELGLRRSPPSDRIFQHESTTARRTGGGGTFLFVVSGRPRAGAGRVPPDRC